MCLWSLNVIAGRGYFKCESCDKFHCFQDTRGNDPRNPSCYCGASSKTQVSGPEKELQEGCIMFAGWEDVTIMMFAGMIRRGRLQWMRASWNNLQGYTLFDFRGLPGGKLLAWCLKSLKGVIGSPSCNFAGKLHFAL
jgi:hypothetical protein